MQRGLLPKVNEQRNDNPAQPTAIQQEKQSRKASYLDLHNEITFFL